MLADWLDALDNKRPVESELDFMEPNLQSNLKALPRRWSACGSGSKYEARLTRTVNTRPASGDFTAHLGGTAKTYSTPEKI